MTHIAALVPRRSGPEGQRILDALRSKARNEMDRFGMGLTVEEHLSPGVWMARHAPAEGGVAGVWTDAGTALAFGRPLLESAPGKPMEPTDELGRIHRDLMGGRLSALRDTRGDFALIAASADGSRVIAAVDHLSVRPLYVAERPDVVIVSTLMGFIRGMLAGDLRPDPLGTLERATLGYPLGRRTPFDGVVRLGPAETVHLTEGELRYARYWNWTEEPGAGAPEPELDEVLEEFRSAIRARLGEEGEQRAFLSGGMDSRAIASLVRDEGIELRTYSFSIPGQKDYRLAEMAAKALGAVHVSRPRTRPVRLREGDWSRTMRSALDAENSASSRHIFQRAWSGDGGSVLAGGGSAILRNAEALKSGTLNDVAASYTPAVAQRAVRSGRRREIVEALGASVRAELRAWWTGDNLRTFHLFLKTNDQRRHLDGHFESLLHHRVELSLPFYDARVAKILARVPVEGLRRHGFYHAWIERFPGAAWSVPWQTYPGHLKCPIPMDALPDQWSSEQGRAAHSVTQAGNRIRRRATRAMLMSPCFPSRLLSRRNLLGLATLDHVGASGRVGYILEFARRVFEPHAAACANPADAHAVVV